MKTKHLVPLFLVILVLSLVVYLFLSKEEPKPQTRTSRPSPFLVDDPSLLKTITLENPSGEIVFQKNEDGWWEFAGHSSALLDVDLVQMLVDEIAVSKRERFVDEDPEDLSVYQLDDPPYKLTLGLSGHPEPRVFYFGGLNPSLDRIYTQEHGHPEVFLIRRGLYMYLPKAFEDFRFKILLLYKEENISRFSVEIRNKSLKEEFPNAVNPVIAKQSIGPGKTVWNIIEPVQEKADDGAVKVFLGMLSHQVSTSVIDMDIDGSLAEFGLDEAQVVVHLTTDDGTRVNLYFGKFDADKKHIYAWDGVRREVYTLPYPIFAVLIDRDFRTHKLIRGLSYGDFFKITVEFPSSPENNYSIIPIPGTRDWRVQGVPSKTFRGRIVRWILGPLKDREFERYIYQDPLSLSSARIDPPRAVIKIYQNEQLAYHFSVGQPDEWENTYVLDQLKNQMMLYNMDVIYDLPPNKEFFFTNKRFSGEIREEEDEGREEKE